tara:strand:+ start:107 stop:508 length:402 start_codon:yes stop_codon:yes gene_type:complete
MSNEDQHNPSTEFESETIIEEPPSVAETLDVLDKVFDNNNDGIDAEKLLADAEIDFSEFLQRVQCQMEQYSESIGRLGLPARSLEELDETYLDSLSDDEVLYYLQAEGIDCEMFLQRSYAALMDTRQDFELYQ